MQFEWRQRLDPNSDAEVLRSQGLGPRISIPVHILRLGLDTA
jgi:hypothetical protein